MPKKPTYNELAEYVDEMYEEKFIQRTLILLLMSELNSRKIFFPNEKVMAATRLAKNEGVNLQGSGFAVSKSKDGWLLEYVIGDEFKEVLQQAKEQGIKVK